MAFSPDGSILVVGSHDNKSYIYDTSNYKLRGTAGKSSSFITAIDFTKDG
jgi:WD40 repeat protein